MIDEKELTPALAEAITGLGASLVDTMLKDMRANTALDWYHAVSAAAVACRGIAALGMARDPDLDLDTARAIMMVEFVRVLALPAELVRTLATEDGEIPCAVALPVQRH